MSKKAWIAVIVVALVAIGAGVATYALVSNKDDETTETTQQETMDSSNDSTDMDMKKEGDSASVEVVYTDNGFDKATYTVQSGETLLIKNDSSDTLQFSSDDHPTHRLNGELNAPAIGPGETTELTPEKVGTFGIHNHTHPEFTTTVEVTK